MATTAFLLLGSNMGDRLKTLIAAVNTINTDVANVVLVSAVYETQPWGIAEQDHFLNVAVSIETGLQAEELLHKLLSVETALGRRREGEKFGPRVIDIDILLFGNEVIETHALQVPHPGLPNRRFALIPLNEIAPDFIHPVSGKHIDVLLAECADTLHVEKREDLSIAPPL